MKVKVFSCILISLVYSHVQSAVVVTTSSTNEVRLSTEEQQKIKEYLENEYEKKASSIFHDSVESSWNVQVDVNNEEKQQIQLEMALKSAEFVKKEWEEHFKDLNPYDFEDEQVRRQIFDLVYVGQAILSEDDLKNLTNQISSMSNIYSTAKLCPYEKQDCNLTTEGLSLDPGIENILSNSTDYDKLLYAWVGWRNASGAKMREQYKQYVELSNKVAVGNDYYDMGDMWRGSFESDNFTEDCWRLWDEIEPLYSELHTYVRRRLLDHYPDRMDPDDPLIPAHLLGNMWAQSWVNIDYMVMPFPNASAIDVSETMREQNYTVLKMFEMSDEFYKSLGLLPNDMSYGEKAMLTKPTDRDVVCHASAWDFNDKKDFRIKMCTSVNMEDFITVHHEMGHIQYYLQYKDQLITFRNGANPGFHEAVGDTIALSVATPQHLRKVELLGDDWEDTYESNINALMTMALERVAFMPFGFLIDLWRWDVFAGNVTENNWNEHWWHYRNMIQKIREPIKRTENDFDPGAKYHVSGDSQYISYFVAHILEFQFHRALCIAAGQYDPNNSTSQPLHKCDIYKSTAAGDILRAGLSLGSSKHWKDVLEIMTGETEMSGSAVLEYFEPLYEFLKSENNKYAAISSPEDVPKEPVSQLIPIVVGSVIGALLAVALVAYFVHKRRESSKVTPIEVVI